MKTPCIRPISGLLTPSFVYKSLKRAYIIHEFIQSKFTTMNTPQTLRLEDWFYVFVSYSDFETCFSIFSFSFRSFYSYSLILS